MTEKKDTVGAIASDLLLKADTPDHSVTEQMREQLDKYDENLIECVEKSKKEYAGDFYVVVITKKERLLENVIRNYFFSRQSCPTPDWDQTVYYVSRYAIEYMWCIPSREICQEFIHNPLFVPDEEKELLKHVLDFNDGTLFRLAKKLNGEELASPLLI
ncbi:MAG: hypothetical protein ACHQVS_00805 [Candidatus Babeliales bacterium]